VRSDTYGSIMRFLLLAPLMASAAPVDFVREVQPILAEHCSHCHGTDEADRRGKLRLDTREGALKGGKSGKAAIWAASR
jgi:hypothetical protein